MFSSVLGGAEPASFAEAALNGWAPDGGMYWPMTIEPVTQATLVAWGGLSYPRLCEEVLKRFIPADDPDISRADLASIVSAAFDAFGSNSVLKVQPLGDGDGEGQLHVVELWHGPTLAFKVSRAYCTLVYLPYCALPYHTLLSLAIRTSACRSSAACSVTCCAGGASG